LFTGADFLPTWTLSRVSVRTKECHPSPFFGPLSGRSLALFDDYWLMDVTNRAKALPLLFGFMRPAAFGPQSTTGPIEFILVVNSRANH